jgi:CRISPR system Cascade subunit CasD
MKTVLLRLEGPLQSWGYDSNFDTRATGLFPTKSGIIGMICAALGIDREENVSEISKLRVGVRIDRPGQLLWDFQTADTGEGDNGKYHYIFRKEYLADASFLAGVEVVDDIAAAVLKDALLNPWYPLYLGRKNCVPAKPVFAGIADGRLEEVLTTADLKGGVNVAHFREIYLDGDPEDTDTEMHFENPVSFSRQHREFTPRFIRRIVAEVPDQKTHADGDGPATKGSQGFDVWGSI